MLEEVKKSTKKKWIEALTSGKYTQGFQELETRSTLIRKTRSGNMEHCCIGVFAGITDGLSCGHTTFSDHPKSPYIYLKEIFGEQPIIDLYRANDSIKDKPGKQNYSNVIPLIANL